MNDKIKELKQQALRWSGENVNRNLYTNYEIEQKEYEKFAELIVKECAAVISKENEGEFETHTDWGDGYSAGLDTAKTAIQEHFGVKE